MSAAPKRPLGPGAMMKSADVRAYAGGIGNTTLHRWLKAGTFPAPRILPGGRRLWVRAEVEAWAAALPLPKERP